MNPNLDVAIIGGGVAGAALALGLAQAGKTVLVLEREATPALNGADVVKPAGINVLRELGILDEIVKRGRVRDRLDVYYDAEFVAALDYKQDAVDNFFVLTPYAAVLEVLRAALSHLPNVEYRCGSPVTQLGMQADDVTSLQLASGEEIRARFYVGADGAQSFVRTKIGLKAERTIYSQRMYFGKFPIVPSVDDSNRLYIDSRGALAYFYPVGRTAFRAVLGFSDPEATSLAGAAPQALRARLRSFVCASTDALDMLDGLASFAQIPVAFMHAPVYGRGNVALVGDAIHCVHPITGQGMNLGIEDAGALTGLMVRMLDGQCSAAECLAAYQRARWEVNRAVVEYGHALATSMTDRQAFVGNFDHQMQASRRRGSPAKYSAPHALARCQLEHALRDYVQSHWDEVRELYDLRHTGRFRLYVSEHETETKCVPTTAGDVVFQVPESLAYKVLASARAFQWGNGVVLIPTVFTLVVRGFLIVDPKRRSASLAVEARRVIGAGYSHNLGNLWAALRLLDLAGWVRLEGVGEQTTFALTDQGSAIVELLRQARDLVEPCVRALANTQSYYKLFRVRDPSTQPAADEYRRLVDAALAGWGMLGADDTGDPDAIRLRARKHLCGYLDGILLAATMVAMGMPAYEKMGGNIAPVAPEIFAKFATEGASLRGVLAGCNETFMRAAVDLLRGRGILEPHATSAPNAPDTSDLLRLTSWGEALVNVAPAFAALPCSYMRTYARIEEVLFGSATDPLSIASDGHVDRVVNVFGSSGAGSGPAVKLICERILKPLFDNPRWDEQPAGLADMGCGDGTALLSMAEYVLRNTARGKHLDTHPLFVIGADFNEAPRARTRATLSALAELAGVRTAVVHADVSDPDTYAQTIRELGFPLAAAGRSLELNDLTHTFMFLVHNRRLTIKTVDEARAVLRQQLRLANARALTEAVGLCSGRPIDLPSDESAVLDIICARFHTSYVDESGLVPGMVVGADLVDFMRRWAAHSRHGFIAVEGHIPQTNALHEPVPDSATKWLRCEKLPQALNWGMHAFSRQYLLPYEQYRLALALAGVSPAHAQVHGSLFGETFPSIDRLSKYRFMSIASYVR